MDSLDCYQEEDDLIVLAEMAIQAGRHEDVLNVLSMAISINPNLGQKARNLFSSASKHLLDDNRHALQVIASYSRKEPDDPETAMLKEAATEYYKEIGKELVELCKKIIYILNHLISNATEISTKVFYQKWLGDCFRYQTEYELHEDRSQVTETAREAYTAGMKLAEEGLDAKDCYRLGLALNYSVFLYEVCDSRDKACEVSQKTLDEGEEALKSNADVRWDCEAVLRLMRDNLTIWKSDSAAP